MKPTMTEEERILTLEEKVARLQFDVYALQSKMDLMADRKTEPSNSEIPNNCEWSVEYAKEMLDTMPCEECGHWEHGAGDHYYCALLEMRQECYFESKGESTLMFANKPKDEPTISKMEQVDEPQTERYCTNCKHNGVIEDYECRTCNNMNHHEFIQSQTDCAWR